MFGLNTGRLGSVGSKTPIQRAIAVLRRFGQNAHVYIPGIGMLNGLQAANYIDSVGTQAGVVDQPVGLDLDAVGVLGVELSLPTTSTAGWVANEAILSVDAGRIKFITTGTGDNGTYEDFSVTAGKTYAIVATLTNAAATSNAGLRAVTEAWTLLGLSNAVSAGATDEVRVVVTATTATLRVAFDRRATGTSGDVIYVASASVREISGIHAIQGTTGNKPTLRLTNGRYNWAFDATDLLTSTFPAGNESVTVIDAKSTGQVTTQGVNVVGAYSMGPSVTLYGRIIVNGTLTAPDLLRLQKFANMLAGL